MAAHDLTDADRAALAGLPREMIERFPLSPRLRELKAILAKVDPPCSVAGPYPAGEGTGEQ